LGIRRSLRKRRSAVSGSVKCTMGSMRAWEFHKVVKNSGGKKLSYFIAYIPGMGEACMKCYTECAKEKEIIPQA
jgi:hypothetical protein